MGKEKIKKSRKVSIVIIAAIILAIIVLSLGILWNNYFNKNNLFARFEAPQGHEIYMLGTLHKTHFNKWLNYSMEDILNILESVQPDVVFIEAREEYFIEYGVMDGPIDMAVVYGYCIENEIQAEMIDWWVVDNNFKENSTNDKRDDMIFANINDKLRKINADEKVLIVCGATHYHEQLKRFENSGFENQAIKNKPDYFKSKSGIFQYPDAAKEVWEQRSYFMAYTLPQIVSQDETLSDEIKRRFTDGDSDAFYSQQLKYCEMFSNNVLYE